MASPTRRDSARDPQDLERLLIARQRAGDVDGMVALYEPGAIVDPGDGRLLRGHEELSAFFADSVASGQRYGGGVQRPALVCDDVALTSTQLPDGSVTAEIAHRQEDGTWRWVIDRFTHGGAAAPTDGILGSATRRAGEGSKRGHGAPTYPEDSGT